MYDKELCILIPNSKTVSIDSGKHKLISVLGV